jgi:hypothetical protein
VGVQGDFFEKSWQNFFEKFFDWRALPGGMAV